ncbi:His-Xaa-Ser system radical SAM maturase HxsC [Carnimonas bestiolae]|uniref:His-Xaa-Ser system radical SAM maturase HxsC n=1 Tax=Carnimonas bestiolae TaxID=3402172 RepID=UPI003EDC1FB3
MARLTTRACIDNLAQPRMFKVITLSEFIAKGTHSCAGSATHDDLLLWVDANAAKLPLEGLPIGGLFSQGKPPLPIVFEGPHVHSLKYSEVVNPGDVIVVDPRSSLVRVLYRRGANSNLLFITDRCNSECLMCSQPPKDVDDAWHIEENLALLNLVDPGEEQLGISGGEPTLYRDGLLRILKKAKACNGDKSLHLLSNGRQLADNFWINALRNIDHPSLMWGIPLYADNARDHDHVVQAPGAFTETLQGIYNLARAHQRIEIRVVLSNLTVHRLPALAYFIFRNMPFVRHVAFMGIENMGLAKKNYGQLWIDPLDYQDKLKEACEYLDILGIPVSIYNLPLCILDASLVRFYRRSISDWKNIYIDTCSQCAATTVCGGFFKSHSERWQSRGVHPMSDEQLIEYAEAFA